MADIVREVHARDMNFVLSSCLAAAIPRGKVDRDASSLVTGEVRVGAASQLALVPRTSSLSPCWM
jgi:hypothetical protein